VKEKYVSTDRTWFHMIHQDSTTLPRRSAAAALPPSGLRSAVPRYRNGTVPGFISGSAWTVDLIQQSEC
jgi:hypothetical protein